MARGRIFDVQRFCLHDGPGLRTTVFLKGCPLSCRWCHNPESLRPGPELMVQVERCIHCGECVRACPEELPRPGEPRSLEETDRCLTCGECVEACPTEARRLAGREVEAEALGKELLRDRIFFDDSGGGVTFSGGEPLQQAEFLLELLAICRREGLHSAVDTSGLAPEAQLRAVAGLTDLVLYDLKVVDPDRHRRQTGVDNRSILENLRVLAGVHGRIWLRVPVVPGVNDDRENLDATARIAARYPAVEKVCLLPYHRIGEGKRDRLDRPGEPDPIRSPEPGRMQQLLTRFEARGIRAQIGG